MAVALALAWVFALGAIWAAGQWADPILKI